MKKLLTGLAIAVAMIFAAPSAALAKKSKDASASASAAKAEEKSDKVDLNTATADELKAVDGIGEAISKKIIDCREKKLLKAKDELKERCDVREQDYVKFADKVIAKQAKGKKK